MALEYLALNDICGRNSLNCANFKYFIDQSFVSYFTLCAFGVLATVASFSLKQFFEAFIKLLESCVGKCFSLHA